MRTVVHVAGLASLLVARLGCEGSTSTSKPPASSAAVAPASVAPAASAAPTASAAPSASVTAEVPPPVVGGPCTYASQPGTCTVTPGDTFTFKGTVDGKSVVLKDNPLGTPGAALPAGKSVPCTMQFITSGTCTPCMFSLGSCGSAAWDAFRGHK